MKKKIATLALMLSFTVFGTAYANTNDTSNETITITEVQQKEIEDSAGVLPDSHFYQLERKIEQLKLAITDSEEKLAELKANYATERACEAVIMTNEGKAEFAKEATAEYMKLLASATKHINAAIEAQEEAVKTIEVLNESYKTSEEILKIGLEKAPEDAKATIEITLAEQDKALVAVNGFYAAKEAFFSAKEQFKQAKEELKIAKKSGDAEAIRAAEEKVKEAEALKDELEGLKDAAESSKEEVKRLVEQAEKGIEIGLDQVEKANEKMGKVEEKTFEDAKKLEEKTSKADQKAIEKAKKQEEKINKELMKAEEKAEKAEEKAIEKAEKAREKAQEKANKFHE